MSYTVLRNCFIPTNGTNTTEDQTSKARSCQTILTEHQTQQDSIQARVDTMAVWVTVLQQNCPAMFAEAVGAWSLQVHYSAVASVIADDTIDVNAQDPLSASLFTDNEIQTQVRNYFDSTVASLGLYSFVYPFERYGKLIEGTNLDINIAFGLDYANRAAFEHAYPAVVTNAFTPMMNAATGNIRGGWLSSMIRNSFAHGQTRIRTDFPGHENKKRVWIWNRNNNNVVTFDVHMDIKDFVALAAEALETFISLVVETGRYEPLSKMLDYELH